MCFLSQCEHKQQTLHHRSYEFNNTPTQGQVRTRLKHDKARLHVMHFMGLGQGLGFRVLVGDAQRFLSRDLSDLMELVERAPSHKHVSTHPSITR